MTRRSDLRIDEHELEERGFVRLPGLVSAADLAEFESTIGELCSAQIEARGIERRHADPFIDVMLADEEYRQYLFPQLRRLAIVERISAHVGTLLKSSGLLERRKFRVPLIWPDVRADLPNETTYQLPLHQDIRSTISFRALRIWLPLRAVGRHHGSMEVVAGSHKLGRIPTIDEGSVELQVDDAAIPEERRICIEAAAGDGILFDPNVIHRSIQNRSERVKFVILIQIQDAAQLYGPSRSRARGAPSPDRGPR
jgi:hypothetical protein